jgi:hypothetical protein
MQIVHNKVINVQTYIVIDLGLETGKLDHKHNRHDVVLEMPAMIKTCGVVHIAFLYSDKVIVNRNVQIDENPCRVQPDELLRNQLVNVSVHYGGCIERIVDLSGQQAAFLCDGKYDWCYCR